ncbi:MAG: branched-chain-amino-acid transaminase [Brevinematia bacterium]
MGNIVFINGEFYERENAKISVFDKGFLYGDGVFEGIRAYDGKIFKLDEHIDRMFEGAKAIMLEPPYSKDEIKEIIIETCRKNDIKSAYIRPVLSRGVGDLGLNPFLAKKASFVVIVDKLVMYPEEIYTEGMSIIVASTVRNSPNSMPPMIKSLNYLNNILAKIEAVNANVPEAVMLNEDGFVAECTGDNIFIVKNGVLITPPKEAGILVGITRNEVIKIAKANGIPFEERLFSKMDLYVAEEIFLTGTGAEVVPVTKVDKRTIGDGRPGKITKFILEEYRKLTRTEGTPIR